jgi:hypothetical protein
MLSSLQLVAGSRLTLRRNRLGLNDWIYEQAQKEKANASKSSA